VTNGLCPITGNQGNPNKTTLVALLGSCACILPARGALPLMLQKVVNRKPVPFMPHKHVPDYLLCYVVETLACGHTLTVYPQTDALVAVRRDCQECGQPVPKKKPYSVTSARPAVERTA